MSSQSKPQAVPFSITYQPASQITSLLAEERLMALISFGQTSSINPYDSRHWEVGIPELGPEHTVEVWTSHLPLKHGQAGLFSFSKNAHVLFACVCLAEEHFQNIATATSSAYQQILAFIQQQEYPCLLRVWNYLPQINQEEQALERYQGFCVGRYEVFQQFAMTFPTLPAATAVGTYSPGILIYFLATKTPGLQIENPRQVSAFCYPLQYSPKSPAFSRAILKQWGTTSHLYVSGTASIVGHESRHESRYETAADLQLQETLHNFNSLVDQANFQYPSPMFGKPKLLKIYIRHSPHFENTIISLKKQLGTEVPIIFLQGDLCRTNLLLEVEGIWET